MNAIYDLLDQEADYTAKYLHPIPDAPVVGRARYIRDACRDKVVLDIGASGLMSEGIRRWARRHHTMDRQDAEYCIDLDTAKSLPPIAELELVIAGEIIEHLSNAGRFLDLLMEYYRGVPVVLTTPNAMSEAGYVMAKRGIENVNLEHVAYYSYYTLKQLVERSGYTIKEWCWYNGKPYTAEGIIFRLE